MDMLFVLFLCSMRKLTYWISYVTVCCVFFQAEDGIRDLVRSRGLGDVYKRQTYSIRDLIGEVIGGSLLAVDVYKDVNGLNVIPEAVSYTHLTLPTSDLV